MKSTFLRALGFAAILTIFTVILIFARMDSGKHLKHHIYDQWTRNFVVNQNDLAYVKTTRSEKEDVVLSESQGYGMAIAVEAAKQGRASQEDFDRLYRYYLAHRTDETQLMSWRQTIQNGQVTDEAHNATDGDLYIAYALIRAAEVWQKDAAEYQAQAKAILQDILSYNYNSETGVLTVGNWANAESEFYNLVRTSDVLPEQFIAFYQLTGDKTWLDIRSNMLAKLETISDKQKTGLIPDFIWVTKDQVTEAKAKDIATEHDGDYSYNACRLPYNLARSKDKTSQKILNKMMDFFMEQKKIYAGYSLKGKPLNDYQSVSFNAPVFYAANMNEEHQKLVQENKYIFTHDLAVENYYESALLTLAALDAL